MTNSNHQLNGLFLGSIITICLFFVPTTDAFAAWFVDRRLSCLTDLAVDEIIMNNQVKAHSASREPSIHIEVSPLEEGGHAAPNSEFSVKFAVPEEARARVMDIEYVIELSSGSGSEEWKEPPAKFTLEPPNGGIGCDERRINGKVGREDATGIFTINEDAVEGDRLEITAGWATGHDAVTLTEKVVVFIGKGADAHGSEKDTHHDDDDDALQDDEAEAELEETLIEEERQVINSEIEMAEEDVVEALEEKRIETDGLGPHINGVEDQVIEALEESGENMNKALDSLKDEVVKAQQQKQRENPVKHDHTVKQRMEAQKRHREHHDITRTEDKLEEMQRRFQKRSDANTDKVEELIKMKDALKNSFTQIHKMDKKELKKAGHKGIKPLLSAKLKVKLKDLKQHAKEKMHKLSDKLGVNELINDPHLKHIRGELRRGLRGEGNGAHHGDVGTPLPPEQRHFLLVMCAFFGLVGLVRWCLDKRRRTRRKGEHYL